MLTVEAGGVERVKGEDKVRVEMAETDDVGVASTRCITHPAQRGCVICLEEEDVAVGRRKRGRRVG